MDLCEKYIREKDYPLALRMENLNLQLSQMFDRDKLYGQDLNHYLMIAECYAEQEKAMETLGVLSNALPH